MSLIKSLHLTLHKFTWEFGSIDVRIAAFASMLSNSQPFSCGITETVVLLGRRHLLHWKSYNKSFLMRNNLSRNLLLWEELVWTQSCWFCSHTILPILQALPTYLPHISEFIVALDGWSEATEAPRLIPKQVLALIDSLDQYLRLHFTQSHHMRPPPAQGFELNMLAVRCSKMRFLTQTTSSPENVLKIFLVYKMCLTQAHNPFPDPRHERLWFWKAWRQKKPSMFLYKTCMGSVIYFCCAKATCRQWILGAVLAEQVHPPLKLCRFSYKVMWSTV